jgi:hypothetical protein
MGSQNLADSVNINLKFICNGILLWRKANGKIVFEKIGEKDCDCDCDCEDGR